MTLNDQIRNYLIQNNIAYGSGDYRTGQPEGDVDQILFWNVAKLGTQPGADQLAAAYAAYQVVQTAAAQTAQLAAAALAALAHSDITVLRCAEGGSAVPAAWVQYRRALRLVVGGAAQALPLMPPYPQWT